MGKHKIIKSAAAVALTASVVATAAAPGASAASYKTNAKDQLVHTSTGKLVKGWKVFGGKLYKNGKLAPAKKYKIIGTGAAQKLFYGPTLKKGYKTANSKTLLFKDGKLADGWKQAGKNERLYKNGKLDKGYTVYTNVEGDKFLYQNGKLKKGQKTATRGGETLLFVDGKLAKGYVLHEASKTLFNNGKVAEGLVKYPETDGKFYNDGKLANGEINGAEYKDGVLVAKDIASVKAINGTTVEVTFKEAQKADDVKAADYKIEGLEVKNAAVKQTDSKVVVLTTSAQEAAKEYTLVYKEADTKTFTGVSAVIPTGIALTKASQQGVIGKEVTVEAQVKVAEGQSKAGIPVTIVVDSNKDTNNGGSNNVASDKKVEVYTDENGVAKYSYTQYASPSEDTVTAYPTGDASVKSVAGIVYWGQSTRLALTEVTEGNTLANGAKKVYKVSSPENANGYINIAFKENINVTPDKLVRDVKVTDAAGQVLAIQGAQQGDYPYQVTTGGVQYTQVKLNANGETTFTLTGNDAAVTPIVFADGKYTDGQSKYTGDAKYQETELQAQAPTVTFAAQATQVITVDAKGTVNAAAADNNVSAKDANLGGRDYTVTVKGTDGKIAPKGTKVLVGFKKGDVKGDVKVFGYNAKGEVVNPTTSTVTTDGAISTVKEFEVDAKGQVTFRVAGEKDAFAKPTVFINNGDKSGAVDNKLDDKDTQTTAETTYFLASKVADAKLEVNDLDKKVNAGETAVFTYSALDQNGFVYALDNDTKATFEVTAKFSDVKVTVEGQTEKTVKAGQTVAFDGIALNVNGQAKLSVKATSPADVIVNASATKVLPNKSESISFVGTTIAIPTTTVEAVNVAAKAGDKDAVKEALKSVDEFANANLTSVEQDEAVANIIKAVKENGSVTSTKIKEILKAAGNDTTTPPTEETTAKQVADAINASNGTQAEVKAALAKNAAYKALTADQKVVAEKALTAVVNNNGSVTPVEVTGKLAEAAKVSTLQSAKYTAAVAAVLATPALSKVTTKLAAEDIKSPATSKFNGFKINFVNAATPATYTTVDTTATLDAAKKEINVVLGGTNSFANGFVIDATGQAVVDAIQAATGATFTVTAADAVIQTLDGETVELGTEGKDAVTATEAKLELTFDANVATTATAEVVVGGTTFTADTTNLTSTASGKTVVFEDVNGGLTPITAANTVLAASPEVASVTGITYTDTTTAVAIPTADKAVKVTK
ncbi:hypothetical protein [Kurthia sp. Dielmo]|uniref:hypothetical protein n=1 Tax=Kurthia sp. Dielmo TaxID=1033738 RepID=UPI0002EDE858|nr:hypothetical protein [Kurthia sp. Dielmo]